MVSALIIVRYDDNGGGRLAGDAVNSSEGLRAEMQIQTQVDSAANGPTLRLGPSRRRRTPSPSPPLYHRSPPRRLCLTLRWRRQWRGGRSGPPWPSANALAAVCTSSPAPNVIDIVYVHGGRGRRRRVEVAAADSFEPRNTGRQTDSSSLHGEKFARFWFHPFFSFFSLNFSAHYWLLNTPVN